jgi:peptide/nickel transport system substrate-binding protein
VTVGTLDAPAAPNPLFASTAGDFTLNSALWGRPVVFDRQFHVLPDQLLEVPLPENGGVQDGGKKVILHLRRDLFWSDGEPIVAGDFRFWWRLNQQRETGATITGGYDMIADIETPDRYTVVLHLKRPFGPYLFYLPYAAPEHVWGKLPPIELQNTKTVIQYPAVTSGPYKLDHVEGTERYVLVPHERYASSTFHGPYLRRLIYQVYSDEAAMQRALQAGTVTVIQGALSPGGAQMQQMTIRAASYEHLDFNLEKPLLQDLRVRKALQAALDVCSLLQKQLKQNDCTRRVNQVEPPPSLYADPSLPGVPYNQQGALHLLAESGWKQGPDGLLRRGEETLSLRLVTTSQRRPLVETIKQAFRAIGIQLEPVYVSAGKLFGGLTRGGVLASGAFDLALFASSLGPEPDDQYAVFHSSQVPSVQHPEALNYGRVRDAELDAALEQGRAAITFQARKAAYQRFLHRVAEQVYTVPLYSEENRMLVRMGTRNVMPHADPVLNLWNIADWWVDSN